MLPTNYRCAPRVLDAARALIEGSLLRAQNKPPLLAAAVAMGHGGGELRTVAFPDRATELDALGGELQRLQRQQPERLCSVAVLCRLRAQVDEVRASAPRPTAVPAPRTLYLKACASRLVRPPPLCTPPPAPRAPALPRPASCASLHPAPHPVPCAPAPRRFARASTSMVFASTCTERATRRASSN